MDATWQRKPAWPKTTWCQTVISELGKAKLTLALAQHPTQNRDKWRGVVVALCPTASCHRELEADIRSIYGNSPRLSGSLPYIVRISLSPVEMNPCKFVTILIKIKLWENYQHLWFIGIWLNIICLLIKQCYAIPSTVLITQATYWQHILLVPCWQKIWLDRWIKRFLSLLTCFVVIIITGSCPTHLILIVVGYLWYSSSPKTPSQSHVTTPV